MMLNRPPLRAGRASGAVLSGLLGPANEASPSATSWEMNPPLAPPKAGPAIPLGTAAGADGPVERVQMPDGSVRGERPPVNVRPDYGAMLAQSLGPRPTMSTGQKIAAIVGPMLMAASGNEAGAMQAVGMIGARGREWDERNREAQQTAVKWGREDALAEAKRNEPRYFSGREDQVRFDPATGTATKVYDAPQDFEDYATARGFEPGSEDYFGAVEDYVLRGNGPTAFKYDADLQRLRQAGQVAQQAARLQGQMTLERQRQAGRLGLRSTPSYHDLHGGGGREAIPTAATPAEAAKLPKGSRFRTPEGQIRIVP